jgi:uncharacterized metal-binding protein
MAVGNYTRDPGQNNVILACSGASDVGEIADRAARVLGRNGLARMFCLTSVAARKPDVLEQLRHADRVLVIDGCAAECARALLAEVGIHKRIEHIDIGKVGFEKGRSPASVSRVATIVTEGTDRLTRDAEASDDSM